jgi:hypothetical protein
LKECKHIGIELLVELTRSKLGSSLHNSHTEFTIAGGHSRTSRLKIRRGRLFRSLAKRCRDQVAEIPALAQPLIYVVPLPVHSYSHTHSHS